MSACEKVQSFLKIQLEKNNLKRVDVARDAGIASYVVHNIFNGSQDDVTLKTVLRLADYFKCSTDEVLGGEKFQITERAGFKPVDSQTSMEKIKSFIKTIMEEKEYDITQFAKRCQLKRWAFRGFISDNYKQKAIGSNYILAIADTFNISIDELIGRTEVNPSLFKSKERADTSSTKVESSTQV